MRAVLAAIHMRIPSTSIGTLFMLVYYRLRLAIRGLRFREREQPTTRRENRSSRTARNSQPWAVAMYVTSPIRPIHPVVPSPPTIVTFFE